MKAQYQRWQEKPLTYGCLLRSLIVVAVILFALAAGTLWVMNTQNMIQGPWASIFTVAFVILGVVFAFVQWYFPRSPDKSQASTNTTKVPPKTTSFIHKVTLANRLRHFTYINHPYANDNPDAIVFVAHNWNPSDEPAEIYNDHHIGVWYDKEVGQWSIYNEDKAEMTVGMAFNVMILDKPDFYPISGTPGLGMGV
jgi:hypothetical protein